VAEASAEDLEFVRLLRSGDEAAFMRLVDSLGPSMLRIAQMYVPSRAVAEEVVQEAWLGVLKGLDRFEGRSSLRTWILRILVNVAKTRGVRERRSAPFSSFEEAAAGSGEPAVSPDRFLTEGAKWAGHWSLEPAPWDAPEQRVLGAETRSVVERVIATLPPGQAEVIRLRDVEGWSSEEVRNALALSETNQRVLLHRARSKVRRALERYFEEERE
jgi:RNA polymerase sigma-70 factor (ECF subfamily)